MRIDIASERRLLRVHPDLCRVVLAAFEISPQPFKVIEGMRTLARQRELFDAGASKTMKSRHLTGHAVDLAPMVGGLARWDWPLFHPLADAMKRAAKQCKVPIEWGGDWKRFKDGPHFQLPWADYPVTKL